MPSKACARCGAANAMDAKFCEQCGWGVFSEELLAEEWATPENVATKACPMCSSRPRETARFCTQCGYQLSEDEPIRQGEGYPFIIGAENSNALLFSSTRLIILSVISLGLYLYYWTYLTWKQLQSETQGVHYPVWHALTLLIPGYGSFRMHRHTRIITELAEKSGVETSLNPNLIFVLVILHAIFGPTPIFLANTFSEQILFAAVVNLTIAITVIVWAQAPLNRHWESSRGESASSAPVRLWEVFVALLGPVIWIVATQLPTPG